MLPVIAIIGRPNVGKSTLFNYLTKSRAALVSDMLGVTRDRQYGEARLADHSFMLVDTAGIAVADQSASSRLMMQQVEQAIDEADCILFMVDMCTGLSPADHTIAQRLRIQSKKVLLVVNKADRIASDIAVSEFHALGLGQPYAIAAKQGRGIKALMQIAVQNIPCAAVATDTPSGIRVAVIGRPNVGKSTLVNRMLGQERVVVLDQPGTTRDSIYIPFAHHSHHYVLIDTAGIRRRARVEQTLEKFSIIKTLQALDEAHVAIFVCDAHQGIVEQDLRLLGLILQAGKGLIVVVNKWDGVSEYERSQVKESLARKLAFVDFARRYFISARHGTGVGKLYHALREAYDSAERQLSTAQLTKALTQAVAEHMPPLIKGRRVRLRYAHMGGHHPMTIVIHGKQTDSLPNAYKKYLANHFRAVFNLPGIPVLIKLQRDKNPYQ